MSWRNWAGTVHCSPQKIVIPNSKEELISIIKGNNSQKRIKAFGARCSWTKIACSDGIMINTRKLNKILHIDVKNRLVTVECGISIWRLFRALKKYNLAMLNMPGVRIFSIAGAIATSTHGSGNTSTLSDFVEELEVINYQGEVKKISLSTDKALFQAMKANLGEFGIVYSIVLRCRDLFTLEETSKVAKLNTLLAEREEIANHNEFYHFMWNPYTNLAKVCTSNSKPVEASSFSLKKLLLKPISTACFMFVSGLTAGYFITARYFPKILLLSNRLEIKENEPSSSHSDLYFNILAPLDYNITTFLQSELCFPVTRLSEALDRLREIILSYSKKNLYVFTSEIRFVKNDSMSLLSPSHGRDSVYINISTPFHPLAQTFFLEVENSLIDYEGRPHFGKINFLNKEKLSQLYSENYDLFLELKRQFDPYSVFSNGCLE